MTTRNVVSRTGALSRWLQFVASLRFFSVRTDARRRNRLARSLLTRYSLARSRSFVRSFVRSSSGTSTPRRCRRTSSPAPWQSRHTFRHGRLPSGRPRRACSVCCARGTSATGTFGSFLIALGFFLLEHFVYETVPLKRAMQPLVVATVSILWMGAGWNYYTDYVHSMPAFSEEVTNNKAE